MPFATDTAFSTTAFNPSAVVDVVSTTAQPSLIKLLEYFNDRYVLIVDIDLEKFFDNVPQDKLMSYVGRVIHDGDTESLIRKYLKVGV